MNRTMCFILFGYLSGNILCARIFTRLFQKEALLESCKDKNPGTANAFAVGGFWCGVLTLLGDLAKGFFPVALYMTGKITDWGTGLVFAAPVIGHNFPALYKFRGGKGIAVTFGCLLGLLPNVLPVGILVFYFVFFSVCLQITPHFYRTLAAYLCALLTMYCTSVGRGVRLGFLIATVAVSLRLLLSREEKEKCKVGLLWKH